VTPLEAERSLPGEIVALWCARLAWVVLPVTTGNAFADALDGWNIGPQRVASVLLWGAWGAATLALFAPRPWGLTLLRVAAPLGVVCVALTLSSTSALSGAIALASAAIGCLLALSGPVANAAGNALAYGNEVRFLMPIPTPLLVIPVPLAILVAGVGIASGPLFLADGNIVAGLACVVAGLPIAALVIRSLDALSRRWVVIVPAGLAIVDPLTLVDPVLLRRESVVDMHRVPGRARPEGVLDLRLGTLGGGIEIALDAPVPFARRRGRTNAELLERDAVAVATIRTGALVALAASRRLPAHE
jgi:hypothetical protein